MQNAPEVISRNALCLKQNDLHPLYVFCLSPEEIFKVAEISRISRGDDADLIGYQRPEVKKHVDEIEAYLREPEVLFPNSLILALGTDVRFVSGRGPGVQDELSTRGTIEIPVRREGEPRAGWIVDGQQRALALQRSGLSVFPVPVAAFITDCLDVQRDQFVRINNAKPLPARLVKELLPTLSCPLPRRLAASKIPSELCDLLNRDDASPFKGLIRRPSGSSAEAVVTDTSVIKMIRERFSPAGCLFAYRDIVTGETDFESVWSLLIGFWTAVKQTFPEAWGLPPTKSRLMHGAGILAMGHVMDAAMSSVDPRRPDLAELAVSRLAPWAPLCRWTSGEWEEIDLKWNEVENISKHIKILSNYLSRQYVKGQMSRTA